MSKLQEATKILRGLKQAQAGLPAKAPMNITEDN